MTVRNLWAEMKTFEANGGFNFGFPWGAGKVIWLDPANGSDSFDGTAPDYAWKTLPAAYAAGASGKNDTIVLISDGTTASTARVDAAFSWDKNALHLYGLCSGTLNNRARIAPTAATTAFANFFTITSDGCRFENVAIVQGFTTGTTSAIALTLSTANRNHFINCHIAGMGDAASAQSTGSRNVKFVTSSENVFDDCTFGVDTVVRTITNYHLEFATASARNIFNNCRMLASTNTATMGGILVGTSGTDRYNIYRNLEVLNSLTGGGVAITGLVTSPANPGGMQVFFNPMCFGVLTYGVDATSDIHIRVAGPVVAADGALCGLSVVPAA